MAAIALTAAQAELISSLTQDDIPIKLRCAICSKLAVNAYRLPCCEQAICEACQSTLPASCPVCEHSPLSADDCNINKSLRTTIRVFIRTEEKKREASRPKEPVEATPPTQVKPSRPSSQQPSASVEPESGRNVEETSGNATTDGAPLESAVTDVKAEQATAAVEATSTPPHQPDNDVTARPRESDDREQGGETTGEMQVVDQQVVRAEDAEQTQEPFGEAETENDEGKDQSAGFNNVLGFDAMSGPFPNASFGGPDFNQMQMMMAMQNGMNPNAFGGFPMMGMPGMSMDPMTMQNMYMNGGFGSQGMGMNGMNINMGVGGFGGGSGSNNNWSGQQSWNNGQDNYNHPSASGMSNGDFGNFNAGFHTGYNQGNYGHQSNYNDYRRGYGFRGRGFRGRGYGGYNRGGGFGYGNNTGFQDQSYMAQQYGPGGQHPQANGLTNEEPTGGNGGETGIADNAGPPTQTDEDGTKPGENDGTGPGKDQGDEGGGDREEGSGAQRDQEDAQRENASGDASRQGSSDGVVQPIPAFDDSFSAQNGDAVFGDSGMRSGSYPRGGFQNGYGHRGGLGGMPPPPPAPSNAPPNAPSGPKAMRQGLPNTSLYTLRARGLIGPDDKARSQSPRLNSGGLPSPAIGDRPQSSRGSSPEGSKRADSKTYRDRSRDRDYRDSRDRDRERDREHRSRDRSESVLSSRTLKSERRESHRHRRDTSASGREDDRDRHHEDDRHERRRSKHRSRRKHSSHRDGDQADTRSRTRDEKYDERSRSASPDDSRRSSHRSRRERDADRRKDREKERDRDGEDDRRRSSHRSRKERDRDRDRNRARDRGKDRGRDYERDREREHRHRSKRSSVEPPTPSDSAPPEDDFNPPNGPRGTPPTRNFDIKGQASSSSRSRDAPAEQQSSRRPSQGSSAAATTDAHAAERERRNRERLLRETQRLAMAGTGKRGRDDTGGDDAGGGSGKRSRRKGRRGEVVSVGEEEERMRRLEAEREERRWD